MFLKTILLKTIIQTLQEQETTAVVTGRKQRPEL